MSSLDRLDNELLKIVFHYVGDPETLLSSAYSCKALNEALGDDEMWITCPKNGFQANMATERETLHDYTHVAVAKQSSSDDTHLRGKSTRENIFIDRALIRIREAQNKHSRRNALLFVLGGAEGFRNMLSQIIRLVHPSGITRYEAFVRGDTIAYITELVDDCIVNYLESALLVAVHGTKSRSDLGYPELIVSDLVLTSRLDHGYHYYSMSSNKKWQSGAKICDLRSTLSDDCRRRIVRLLTYKAGIVKLSAGAFTRISQNMFELIASLVFDAIDEGLCHAVDGDCRVFSQDENVDLLHVAPPCVTDVRTDKMGREYAVIKMTIVPRQIKDGAIRRNIVPPLLDSESWIPASSNSCVKDEIMEAKEQYYRVRGMNTIPWFLNSKIDRPTCDLLMRNPLHEDSDSEFDSSGSESTFSMYSDRMCKDRDNDDEDDGDSENDKPAIDVQIQANQGGDVFMMDSSSVTSFSS